MQVPRDPRVESWQLQHYQHGSNIVPTLFQQPSGSSGNDWKARPLRKKDGFFDFHELDQGRIEWDRDLLGLCLKMDHFCQILCVRNIVIASNSYDFVHIPTGSSATYVTWLFEAKNMGGLQAGSNWDDYSDAQWASWRLQVEGIENPWGENDQLRSRVRILHLRWFLW